MKWYSSVRWPWDEGCLIVCEIALLWVPGFLLVIQDAGLESQKSSWKKRKSDKG